MLIFLKQFPFFLICGIYNTWKILRWSGQLWWRVEPRSVNNIADSPRHPTPPPHRLHILHVSQFAYRFYPQLFKNIYMILPGVIYVIGLFIYTDRSIDRVV